MPARVSPTAVDRDRERKFLAKMLYRAICDFVNNKDAKTTRRLRLHEEAKDWLFGEPEEPMRPVTALITLCDMPEHAECWTPKELRSADQFMSFITICDILGWDVGWVRNRIGELTKADLRRIGKNGVL